MKAFRINLWWSAIIPQVLGWIYFSMLTGSSNSVNYQSAFFFCVALLSVSAFGYALNDYYDRAADEIIGKKNFLHNKTSIACFFIIVIPFGLGLIAWFFLKASFLANVFFLLQIISLTLYSAPPVRLKTKGSAGIIADAFYGHINPVLITLFVFGFDESSTVWKIIFFLVLVTCTFIKGVRNILLHQLHDRKGDKKTNTKTFVVKNGALFSLNFINRVLPVEILFTVLLSIIISVSFPPFFLSALIFSILTYLKFSGWKLAYLPKRQLKFKFLYFLNDYYEGWAPVFFLILLGVRNPAYFFLLLLHLVLFPAFILKLGKDLKTIRQNFKTEEDY